MRVRRFDFNAVRGKPRKTPQGFLRVDAFLTRVGVFEYRRRDGSKVRELRPPDEVFNQDSIATLRGAPVTNRHPSEMVSPNNVKALSVGIVNEDVRQDGDKLAGSQTVMDAVAIQDVQGGKLREVSLGYQVDLDATPGRFDAATGQYGPHVARGEAYDVVQRAIVYNHAALGPRNWGRMGNEVALKLDSLDLDDTDAVQIRSDSTEDDAGTVQPPVDPRGKERTRTQPKETTMDMISIRIDAVDYEVPKAVAPHVSKAITTRDEQLDKLKGERDGLQGKLDQAGKDLKEVREKLDEATDPKKLQERVDARAELESNARKVLGDDVKFDGKSDLEIKQSVIKHVDEGIKLDGQSEHYVNGRFDAVVDAHSHTEKRDTRRALDDATTSDPRRSRDDRRDRDTEPRRDPDDIDRDAWTQPLGVSLDRR